MAEAERAGWPIARCPPSSQRAAMLRMLVQLREDAGVKQTELAERLGITQSEVSKFERGERALDVLRLRAWLGALGIGLTAFADALDQELDRLAFAD
ncbi:MAG TPA: helix-turn-helix transcriptional regulator [Burkholderiaceae bacterium]|nr:helix-turn-helix transcriptional regulator [Burkholderiaceae bacterium]